MQPMIAKIQDAARLDVPASAAGTWTSFKLEPKAGGRDVNFATYFLVSYQASSTTNVQARVGVGHGPESDAITTHTTAAVSASAIASVPQIRSGDTDHSKMIGEVIRPQIDVQTVDGNAQWVVAEVWELRHAFPLGEGLARHRKIAGPMHIQSGAVGAAGYALAGCEQGNQVWQVQYTVVVLEASSSGAKLGCAVDHSPDSGLWVAQRTIAAAAVGGTGPLVMVFESDATLGLGQHFRARLITDSTPGDTFVVEVWETVKPFAP